MRKARKKAIETRVKSGVESIHTIDEQHFHSAVTIGHYYRPDHFTVMLLEEGELMTNYNLEDVSIKGPAVMFTVPDSQYVLKSKSEHLKLLSLFYSPEFVAETGIHLTGTAARKFIANGLPTYSQLQSHEFSLVQKLMDVLHFHINDPEPHEYHNGVIKNCFLALIFEVGAVLLKNIPVQNVRLTRKESLTFEFLELLSIHFHKERQVAFYADKLNVTARHLTHTTKAVFGKSAGEMIDEIVINEAKNLLQNPQYNIGQISDALNFSNSSFFGKYFKKHTGKAPTAFRMTKV